MDLSPEKVKELNNKLYLYHPREAMPQHHGIYGTGEGFHPAWFLDDQTKENVTALLEVIQDRRPSRLISLIFKNERVSRNHFVLIKSIKKMPAVRFTICKRR